MFRIYKPTYTILNKATGQRETRTARNWYISVPQGAGKRPKAVPGFKDRRATEAKALQLEQQLERIAAGILTADVDHAGRPLADHLEDFAKHLRDKGDSAQHVQLTRRRVELLIAGAGWKRIADMDQSSVLAYLAKCKTGKGPTLFAHKTKRMSRETANHYIRAVKAFAAWLLGQRRCLFDALAGLHTSNPEVDRRHVRRTLSPADFAALLSATKARPFVRCGLCGADRWALYMLAAYSGLRCGELAALTVGQLQLDVDPPSVAVAAADDKAGRAATIPLPAAVAAQLRPWLAGRPPGAVFPAGSWWKHAAQMLRGDLKAAGIPYADDGRRVFDFHSLRSQYATALARAGVDLRTTQRLMRHSSPLLTAKHYTRLELDDLADAASKLPPPPK